MKFTIVFGYRNRDIQRVKRCFDSLAQQTFTDFNVIFTDFGSDEVHASKAKELCDTYPFVTYVYNNTKGLPWNRSHALNTGARLAKGEYVIFGDVDLIYSSNFLSSVDAEAAHDKNLYGEYYHLPEHFNKWDAIAYLNAADFASFGPAGKGGVHIVHKKALEHIGGYDEFYCYWGVEDRDLHWRLTAIGLKETWLTKQAPVFHQWHPLTSDFYNSGFPLQWWEDMNLYFERNKKKTARNPNGWGRILTTEDRPSLNTDNDNEIIELHCKDAIYGKGSKSNIMQVIYHHLNELNAGKSITFQHRIEHAHLIMKHTKSFSAFSKVVINKQEWEQIQLQFERFGRRMNHFIPDEDLIYIFRQIIMHDDRFDYSFVKSDVQYSWTFALK